MKWFYIWSLKYRHFHEYLQEVIPRDFFEVVPIHIPQEVFDTQLYKAGKDHPWCGCNIKLEVILDILRNKVAPGEMFVFTDVDIFVLPDSCIRDLMNMYNSMKDVHIVFSAEYDSIQIGSMCIRNSPLILEYFENVYAECVADPEKLDTTVIIHKLKTFKGEWKVFDTVFVGNCLNLEIYKINNSCIINLMGGTSFLDNDIHHKREEFNRMLDMCIRKNIFSADYNKYKIPLLNDGGQLIL